MKQTGARYLIATWDGGGNVPPLLNLGSRLAERGHTVRLLGWEETAARAESAGIEFTAYRHMPPWPADVRLDDAWELVEDRLFGSATRDAIIAEAEIFDADVLVIDCMLTAGFDAARLLGLPAAAVVHVLYSAFVHEWGDGVMHCSVASLFAGADRVLALTPPGFDAACAIPANTAYVGPVCRSQPPHPLVSATEVRAEMTTPGDPWVLLSLSTTLQGQAAALPPLLSALGRLPARVLLTLGGVLPASTIDAPANVTVRDFVPHEAVLPFVSAVVSHGGLSTITTSLAAGVPLVCISQGRDQPLNAARVAACGVGRSVPPDAPESEIAAAVESLLRDEGAHEAARHYAATIAALGAGAQATDLVEQLTPV
jgi:UDP:flavonoid glycosyltransferase YjiC (YdhE family)